MQSMFEEVLDELSVTDASTLGGWFEQFGKIIEWCGSGDDSILPDAVREALADQYPDVVKQPLAIEAPTVERIMYPAGAAD
jgi:hypothetical protein